MKGKDFVSISDLSREDLMRILDLAIEMKQQKNSAQLSGKTLGMIFEKPSLRTRVSFDVAMYQLGGHAIYLSDEEIGLGKREPISDVARVISRYVDLIMARTFSHNTVVQLAQHATVPVINGLSDEEHPCQTVADMLTILENKGTLENLTVAYIGDGNNVAASLLLACALIGIEFRFVSPKGYEIPDRILQIADTIVSGSYELITSQNPEDAVSGADVVYTDVWTSMGQEAEKDKRRKEFMGFTITSELLAKANPDAILMHPMPVHYGEELAEGMIDSPQSVLIDQAENRLHAQKAILLDFSTNQE